MTSKAFDLQREVKVNAEEYQTYLKELYRWEDEIKVKENKCEHCGAGQDEYDLEDEVVTYLEENV